MEVSSVSRSRVAFIPEVTEGTTPASPTFQTFRRTGGGLNTRKVTEPSGEIQPDRNVRDVYELAQHVEGSYDFEFSHATLDAFIEAVLGGAWTTNVATIGTVEKFFTFEELDVSGATNLFARFVAARIKTLQLKLEAEKKVVGSIGIMARQESLAAAIITLATYTAANTEAIETGITPAFAQFFGLAPVPELKSLTLNIDAGISRNMKLGSKYPTTPSIGQVVVTGDMEIYFDANTQMDLALNHTAGQLQFTFGAVTAKKYTVNMPSARILSAERVRGGNGDAVMARLQYQAKGDATTPAISITRVVA